MSLIELKGVSYQYPLESIQMIQNINLTIDEGKVYGIIGNNQAGKSTLCNIIRGFIPTMFFGELEGEVKYRGNSLSQYNIGSLAAKIGYSSQNPFTQISGVKDTVEEEIAYGMENIGMDVAIMNKKVPEMIELFRLEELRDKNPYELSGGQKQRVALASIVALDPEIIILDEPTSQLDPQSTEEVFKIISMLKDIGKTIIVVEHKVDLLAEFCDEILLMENGSIVNRGSANEILSDPETVAHGGAIPQVAEFFINYLKDCNTIPITMSEAITYLKEAETK